MILFPKPTKRIKPRKPLRRGRQKIATKSKFKAWGANSCKTYRRKFTDYQVMIRAEICRQDRLRKATEAENTFAGILTRLGVNHEREKILLNGDRWVLIDFYIPAVKLAIELDGAQHRDQKGYDHGRSMWLARTHGIKVLRLWNRAVFDGKAEERVRQMLGLPSA